MWHPLRAASKPVLREALGDDYAALAATSPACRCRRRGVFGTGWSRRRYVEKTSIVRYGPHGRANLADIWRRSDLPRDGHAPVLLQVPGGAWAIGMRRPQAYPMMSDLAERGWICVSMAYRVSPRNTWPDHIVDVKRALAWVKENIADYGGDPDFVAISGGSAGGHLAALAALTPNDPQYQPGFEDADTSVVAAVPVYGRYDWFSPQGCRAARVHRPPGADGGQEADSTRTARTIWTRHRSPGCVLTRHRFSCCTAPTIRSFRSMRPASSSPRCAKCPTRPSRTRRCHTPSTRSISSVHRAGITPPRRSSAFCPGCTPGRCGADRAGGDYCAIALAMTVS